MNIASRSATPCAKAAAAAISNTQVATNRLMTADINHRDAPCPVRSRPPQQAVEIGRVL